MYNKNYKPRSFSRTENNSLMQNRYVDDPTLKPRIEALLNNTNAVQDSWLLDFLKSILLQFENKGRLSQAQVNILEKNEKKYDPALLAEKNSEHEKWIQEYTTEKRERAIFIAAWYKKQAENHSAPYYYSTIAEPVLNDPAFIPTREQYAKMVENKHAISWHKNYNTPPKFALHDHVTLNSQCENYYISRKFDFEFRTIKEFAGGFIVEVKPPLNNVKGGRIYSILPCGGSNIVDIEERFLKKAK